jgi:hypothetical protein
MFATTKMKDDEDERIDSNHTHEGIRCSHLPAWDRVGAKRGGTLRKHTARSTEHVLDGGGLGLAWYTTPSHSDRSGTCRLLLWMLQVWPCFDVTPPDKPDPLWTVRQVILIVWPLPTPAQIWPVPIAALNLECPMPYSVHLFSPPRLSATWQPRCTKAPTCTPTRSNGASLISSSSSQPTVPASPLPPLTPDGSVSPTAPLTGHTGAPTHELPLPPHLAITQPPLSALVRIGKMRSQMAGSPAARNMACWLQQLCGEVCNVEPTACQIVCATFPSPTLFAFILHVLVLFYAHAACPALSTPSDHQIPGSQASLRWQPCAPCPTLLPYLLTEALPKQHSAREKASVMLKNQLLWLSAAYD